MLKKSKQKQKKTGSQREMKVDSMSVSEGGRWMETCAQKWCSTPAVDTRIVQLKLRAGN